MNRRKALSANVIYVVCGFVLLVSACGKLISLGSRELWLDETYSAYAASLHFGDLLRFISGDVHPPLFYVLLSVWTHAVGDTQIRLRLFSVLVNIIGMVAMFFLGRRVLGLRFGALAATLFALSPMLFVYSLEVRSYMLFVLIFVGLLLVHWKIAMERDGSPYVLAAYVLASALLFYTHYLSVFILLGLFVHWVGVSVTARRQILRAASAAALILLLISPGMPVLLKQHALKQQLDQRLKLSHSDPEALSFSPGGASPQTSVPSHWIVKNTAAMSGFYPSSSVLAMLVCAVPLIGVLAGIMFLTFFRSDAVCRMFSIVAITTGAGVYALHLTSTRYILALIPILVLAMARVFQFCMEDARWRGLGAATAGLVLAVYALGFYRHVVHPYGHPWQNVVLAVRQNYNPGDEVIFNALYAQVPFDYFARNLHFSPRETGFPISIYDWWNKQQHRAWGGPVIMQSDLDRFVAGLSESHVKTVWLVLYENSYYDPQNKLLERMRRVGQATEIVLPADPDDPTSGRSPGLRLIRVTRQ